MGESDRTASAPPESAAGDAVEKLERIAAERRALRKEVIDTLRSGGEYLEEYLPHEITKSVAVPIPFTRCALFGIDERRSPSLNPRHDTGCQISELLGAVSAEKWAHHRKLDNQFYTIYHYGPSLDTYDEEVFFALQAVTRQKLVTGRRRSLPVREPRLVMINGESVPHEAGDDETATVIIGTTSAYQLNTFLGKDIGGLNLARTRYSIAKLALTSLVFHHHDFGRYGVFQLFSYLARTPEAAATLTGELTIQWSSVLVDLMSSGRVYIDLTVRKGLSATGKAIHRFLSSQLSTSRPHYEISFDKLQLAIGTAKPQKYFRRDVDHTLRHLIDCGWLDGASTVVGTGRSRPFKLIVHKLNRRRGRSV